MSLLLVTDDDHGVTRSECPYCQRFLCVQCRCEWHSEIKCNEFRQSKKAEEEENDMLLHQIAEKKKWRRCPQCNIHLFMEINVCDVTHCRCCSCCFCYRCAAIIGDPKRHPALARCDRLLRRTTTSEKPKDRVSSDSKSTMRMRIKITDSYGTHEFVHEFSVNPAGMAPQPSSNINSEERNTLEDID